MRRIIKAALASAIILAPALALPVAPAVASELADAYNHHTDVEFRKGLQMRLAWTGDYAGPFDGVVGATTLRAIRDFQARNGLVADGVMNDAFLQSLLAESDKAVEATGFAFADDTATGVRVGVPGSLVSPLGRTEVGTMWRSTDGAIEVETVRFAEEGYSLRDIFEVLGETSATKSVDRAEFAGASFTLSGVEDGRKFFIRFDGRGEDLRGFSVAYRPEAAASIEPYLVVAANSFDAFYGEPATAEPQDEFGPMARLSREERYALAFTSPGAAKGNYGSGEAVAALGDGSFDASGTGFVVSEDGWLLTNAHVTNACKTVLVGDHGAASEVIVDEENDLALVRVDGADFGEPLAITAGKPRLGEDILALGYPLRSILADSLNVTRGNVSSLLGLMNDPNYLQISAAVQPGNSGGPVIDLAGRVVGVVTAKLNAVAVADLTGDIPQAINFAIRPDAAVRFLEANEVDYVTADENEPLASVPDATAEVQDSIVPILCLGSA